jgi:branched-chain amino acid transport system substrate-binding protein
MKPLEKPFLLRSFGWIALFLIFFITPPFGWAAKRGDQKTVKIGVITEETGPGFYIAQAQKKALEIGAEEINVSGGFLGRRLRLIIRDGGNDPDRAATLTRDLIQKEGVQFLIGPLGPETASRVAAVAEAYQKIILVAGPLPEKPTLPGKVSFLFQFAPTAAMEGRAAALILASRSFNSAVLIFRDDGWGKDLARAFKEKLMTLKPAVRIVKEIAIDKNEPDLTPVLKDLESCPAEVLTAALNSGDLARLLRHGRNKGLFPKMSVIARFDYDLFKNLGQDMMPGLQGYDLAPFYALSERRLKSFVKKYRLRCEEFPSPWAVMSYDALIALRKAVEKAKSLETDKVIRTLNGLRWDSLRGPLTLRPFEQRVNAGIIWGTSAKDPRISLYILNNIQYIPEVTLRH